MILNKLCILLVGLVGFQAHASKVEVLIHEMDRPEHPEKQDILLFSRNDMRAFRLNPSDHRLIRQAEHAIRNRTVVEIDFDDATQRVTSIEEAKKDTSVFIFPFLSGDDSANANFEHLKALESIAVGDVADDGYQPTDFATEAQVQSLYNSLNTSDKRRSQCYQRAHWWAYQLDQQRNVKSQKVFMFFSRKYIREYNYHWWFHVAPFVLVKGEERVLDPTFVDHPKNMKDWSADFIDPAVTCKKVNKYKDYENNQEAEYCYFRYVPMYYFQPLHIEAHDEKGEVQKYWNSSDLSFASRAFRNP